MNNIENSKYDILTPTGFKNFKGIQSNGIKKVKKIVTEKNETIATDNHFFYRKNKKTQVKDLKINDYLDGIKKEKILSIDNIEDEEVFDIIEVNDINHQFIINNNIITKNCDELAYVKPNTVREFWTSSSLTLSTGGKCIVTSTPNSDEDQFAEIWQQANKTTDEFGNTTEVGVNGFKAFRAYWNEHPDRDESWANEQRELIGDERFKREIECEFIIYEETLINPVKLLSLEGREPILKQGQVRWYEKPKVGFIYLVGLDPSLGTGGDQSAIQIVEASTLRQIGEWCHNKTPIEQQIKLLAEITNYLVEESGDNNNVYYTVENNTLGEASLVAIRDIGEENIPGIFLSESVKVGNVKKIRKGFNTTNSNKVAACAKLKNYIETEKLKINSKKLISELKTFVSVGNTFNAKPGSTDDLVTSMLLVIRMVGLLQEYLPDMENINEDDEESIPLPFIMTSSY